MPDLSPFAVSQSMNSLDLEDGRTLQDELQKHIQIYFPFPLTSRLGDNKFNTYLHIVQQLDIGKGFPILKSVPSFDDQPREIDLDILLNLLHFLNILQIH